jgi:hypothetical protein
VHGVGFAEKIYDIASGVATTLQASNNVTLETELTSFDTDLVSIGTFPETAWTVQAILAALQGFLQLFRGGDHPYNDRLRQFLADTTG